MCIACVLFTLSSELLLFPLFATQNKLVRVCYNDLVWRMYFTFAELILKLK